MALSEHYDLRYLDPEEAVSDFPSQWDHVIDKIDTAIHDAATAPVSLSRLPSLPAGKVTSGTFAQARIPNLPASQTTTGTFADARIPNSIARTSDVDDETAALKKRIKELEDSNRDTGLRDISDSILDDEGWTGDNKRVRIQRTGRLVFISATGFMRDKSKSGWTTLVGLPLGFRPPDDLYARDFSGGIWRITRGGSVQIQGPGRPLNYISSTYPTNQTWPSSLPGDPA